MKKHFILVFVSAFCALFTPVFAVQNAPVKADTQSQIIGKKDKQKGAMLRQLLSPKKNRTKASNLDSFNGKKALLFAGLALGFLLFALIVFLNALIWIGLCGFIVCSCLSLFYAIKGLLIDTQKWIAILMTIVGTGLVGIGAFFVYLLFNT